MPEVVFSVDQSKSMRDQAVPGHNRWHPDIPPAASVTPGSEFRVECREWTDAQIGNNDSANDVRDVDLTAAHMLSGPDRGRGRRAGRPARGRHPRPRPGRRQQSRRRAGPGLGLHRASSPRRTAAASSPTTSPTPTRRSGTSTARTRPRGTSRASATPASPTPGCSAPRRRPTCWREWNRREQALIDTDPDRVPPLALPPLRGRRAGRHAERRRLDQVGREGARTVPARENGGNHDIKNFTRGSRVFYPVHVTGAQALGRRPALLARATARSRSAARSRWAASSTSAST